MNQNITLKKIAGTLNLSVSTVSRALKNHPDISKNTKIKVEELAKILEYEPNTIAVQLRTNTSKLFGLIVPSISNYFYNSFIEAIEKDCNINGYSLLIFQSSGDTLLLSKNLQTCKRSRVNGIFVCTDSLQNLDEFYKLKSQKIPVIFFDKVPTTNEFHKICLEDEKAAVLAANYIISKNKKIFLLYLEIQTYQLLQSV